MVRDWWSINSAVFYTQAAGSLPAAIAALGHPQLTLSEGSGKTLKMWSAEWKKSEYLLYEYLFPLLLFPCTSETNVLGMPLPVSWMLVVLHNTALPSTNSCPAYIHFRNFPWKHSISLHWYCWLAVRPCCCPFMGISNHISCFYTVHLWEDETSLSLGIIKTLVLFHINSPLPRRVTLSE